MAILRQDLRIIMLHCGQFETTLQDMNKLTKTAYVKIIEISKKSVSVKLKKAITHCAAKYKICIIN